MDRKYTVTKAAKISYLYEIVFERDENGIETSRLVSAFPKCVCNFKNHSTEITYINRTLVKYKDLYDWLISSSTNSVTFDPIRLSPLLFQWRQYEWARSSSLPTVEPLVIKKNSRPVRRTSDWFFSPKEDGSGISNSHGPSIRRIITTDDNDPFFQIYLEILQARRQYYLSIRNPSKREAKSEMWPIWKIL